MSSKKVVFDRKMQWLCKIKENKEVLFGAFSDTLRKEHKVKKWKELATLAQSICLMPVEKDWTYARDTLWQNLKKSAMLKFDNAKKTGTGGMGKMSEIEKAVLDIIGKYSPVFFGLGISESMDDTPSQSVVTHHVEKGDTINKADHDANPTVTPNKTGKRKRTTEFVERVCENEKKEKLKLQNEYLRLKAYKTKLEILKLENELSLPRSEFTKSISNPTNMYNQDSSSSAILSHLPDNDIDLHNSTFLNL